MIPQVNNQESNIEIPSLDKLSKIQLTTEAIKLVNNIAEEGGDILGLVSKMAKVGHFATEAIKAGKARGYEDVANYGPGGVTRNGVSLITKDAGVKYDYSADPIWQQLKADADAAKKLLDDHQEVLKRLPTEGRMMLDPETGEMYTARRPIKTATPTVEASIL